MRVLDNTPRIIVFKMSNEEAPITTEKDVTTLCLSSLFFLVTCFGHGVLPLYVRVAMLEYYLSAASLLYLFCWEIGCVFGLKNFMSLPLSLSLYISFLHQHRALNSSLLFIYGFVPVGVV